MLDDARPAGIGPSGQPGRAGRVRFNLPPVAPSFTGREDELAALDAKLGQDDRALITQAITGLGGVGKSQLAARYAQTRCGAYDVVAWVGAEDGGIADLSRLAVALGLSVDELAPADRARAALEWLAGCDRRWLLVLDNVESAEQLRDLLPRGERGRVLVTSRDRTLRQFGPVLAVGVFDEDTATRYLTERAERSDDEPGARELARALGCLPLALAHAAAYCVEGTSFTDYRLLLDGLPAVELFDSRPDLSYAQTVASTWKPSIDGGREARTAGGRDARDGRLPRAGRDPQVAVRGARRRRHAHQAASAWRTRSTRSRATASRPSTTTRSACTGYCRRPSATTARPATTAARRSMRSAPSTSVPHDVALPEAWPLCEKLLAHALALADTIIEPGDAGAATDRPAQPRVSVPPSRRSYRRAQPATAKATHAHADTTPRRRASKRLTSRSHLASAYHWAGALR